MTTQYEIDLRKAIKNLEAIRVGKPASICDLEKELKSELRGYLMRKAEERQERFIEGLDTLELEGRWYAQI